MQPNQRAAAGRVPSLGWAANPAELKDQLEQYEHPKSCRGNNSSRSCPQTPQYPAALITDSFRLPVIAPEAGSLEKRRHETEDGIVLPSKESGRSGQHSKDTFRG